MPASFQEYAPIFYRSSTLHRANNFQCRIINSRLFKFIVGETIDGIPTEFSVHEGAIAQLSKPLHSLVKGGLSEAQAGCAIWKDVNKETFERFVQFAYTGDYSIPKTTMRNRTVEPENSERNALAHRAPSGTSAELKESEPVEEKPAEEPAEEPDLLDDLRPSWMKSTKVKKDKKRSKETRMGLVEVADPEPEPKLEPPSSLFRTKRDRYPEPPSPKLLAADFHSLSFPLLAPRNSYGNTCEPAKHFEPSQSYSLKALAIYKLHKSLCIFQLDDENVEDIVELARYVYSDEGKGFEEGIGGLRGLVCQYMATNAVVLSLDAGFMDLLGEGGQFVKDFFKFELQRIH
jgi:hypothetical protein